jgi:hypothetical protein
MPDRCGDVHQPRRPVGGLVFGAFIRMLLLAMISAARPYHNDIILIVTVKRPFADFGRCAAVRA